MDIPLCTLCQVNPCGDARNHLIHETCMSTVIKKNLLQFNNDVSDQHNIHVMTLEGDEMTYTEYTSSKNCTGPSTAQKHLMGECVIGSFYNLKYSSSTYTPPKSSSKSSLDNLKACFAGSETVRLESGEVRAISDARVGDRVLSADAAGRTPYSDVVYVPHRANSDDAIFTHITTASGRDIKTTPSHIILAGPCHSSASLPLTYASSVSVGDCVMTVSGEDMVSTVGTVQGKGLYTVVTKEEYLVVNGIIASPFAGNHMVANLYYNFHRFVYSSAPSFLTYPALHFANEVRHCHSLFK
jgi:Hint module